jgi:hypothetical protein
MAYETVRRWFLQFGSIAAGKPEAGSPEAQRSLASGRNDRSHPRTLLPMACWPQVNPSISFDQLPAPRRLPRTNGGSSRAATPSSVKL